MSLPTARGAEARLVVAAIGALGLVLAAGLIWGGGGSSSGDGCAAIDMAVSPEARAADRPRARSTSPIGAQVDGSCVKVVPHRMSSGLGGVVMVDGWDEAAEGPKPVVWSPASSGWGAIVDHHSTSRRDPSRGEAEPIHEDGRVVIAMPKPIAEAIRWPETPIGWSRCLRCSPRTRGGMGCPGHPEWGPFRLGKTNPHFSTSGLSALVAQSYAATGKSEDLTSDDLGRTRPSRSPPASSQQSCTTAARRSRSEQPVPGRRGRRRAGLCVGHRCGGSR